MIRASIKTEDGKPDLMILGLTAGNIARLTKGEPILVCGNSVNLPATDVFIVYGDSPAEVMHEMKQHGLELPDPVEVHIQQPLQGGN